MRVVFAKGRNFIPSSFSEPINGDHNFKNIRETVCTLRIHFMLVYILEKQTFYWRFTYLLYFPSRYVLSIRTFFIQESVY